jgi:hypothetical protein
VAITAYGVKQVVILGNGITCDVGHFVQLESTSPTAVQLLASGAIVPKTSETVLDFSEGDIDNAPGLSDAAGLQTYTVQAVGSGKVIYNGNVLTTGNTLPLDPTDSTAVQMVSDGWIA